MIPIDHFNVGKYRFTLEVREDLLLPPYKGSTFRGGFGSMFKKITCFENNKNARCFNCMLKDNCPYYYIFETTPPPNPAVMRENVAAPRPFVLEPPLEEKEQYALGDTISFNLVLIGRALDYLPYFVVVFKELGDQGIGRNRGKYNLTNIEYLNLLEDQEITIFNSKKNELLKDVFMVNGDEIVVYFENVKVNSLKLHFLTPTRIKHEGEFIRTPEMHIIVRNLLRRINLLSYCHHDGKTIDYNIKEITDYSQKIHIESEKIEWQHWVRYSKRQKNRMDLGGFVGEVIYRGPIKPFLPILFLGSSVHLGKNSTFGLGKYNAEIR